MGITSGGGTLLPSVVNPKPVDGILMEATVRNGRVDGTKVEVCRTGKFEQALCGPVTSIYLIIY